MKTIKQILSFILDLALWIVAYVLVPIVEMATFIVVIFKYGLGALNYFKGEAYSFDVKSSSRNRSLWNFLFVNKNGYKFTKDTKKSISWHIGINSYLSGLTWFGWVMYVILYFIDVTEWCGKGHCRACINKMDYSKYISNGTRN